MVLTKTERLSKMDVVDSANVTEWVPYSASKAGLGRTGWNDTTPHGVGGYA